MASNPGRDLGVPPARGGGIPPPAEVALVTGASGGIGRELAVGLARAGLAVALNGRSAERLEGTRRAVQDAGGRCCVVPADVTDYPAVVGMVEQVRAELGGIDLLVNNAGLIEAAEVPVWEADPEEWRGVVDADLLGPFHCVRAVVPGMLAAGGGRVIDLNSGTGARDTPIYSAYAAAKAGLFRVGGAVHAAGYDRGLRAFEVAPGVVRTAMTAGMPVHAERTDWTEPQDVVDLVVAVAAGRLDAWSGRFLRVGADTVSRLEDLARDGLPPDARTLRLVPYAADDPLA